MRGVMEFDVELRGLHKGIAVGASLARAPLEMMPVECMSDDELFATPTGSVFVYDIECYRNFFYLAFKCVASGKVVDFEISPDTTYNRSKLRWMIWRFCLVGFNSKRYDIYMLLRSLDEYVTTKQLKEMSDDIIKNDLRGFAIERQYGLDVPNINHIDLIEVAPLSGSLKTYGGRLHTRRMQDLPFPAGASLTKDEAEYVKNYCANDLNVTAEILLALKDQLALREKMGAEYQLDLRSKSDAQIAEAVIGKEIVAITGKPPRKPAIPPEHVIRYQVPDYIRFETEECQRALEAIRGAEFALGNGGSPMWPKGLGIGEKSTSGKAKGELKVALGESVYKMGMGGLHSSEKTVAHIADENVVLSDHDVESYYPRIILNQGLFPQHLGQVFLQVFGVIVDRRVSAKRRGDKSTADSLKITINGTFGKLGSKYSILYAPDLLLQVTISGQLSLLMLIERFELAGISVISANTDGIVIKCRKDQLVLRDNIIKQWEGETRFKTEETRYLALYSRDVNNYIAIKQKFDTERKEWIGEPDGCKFKGAYSNPWADPKSAIFRFHKNPEATICVEAAEKFLTAGTPIENTITESRDITKFVHVRNVKGGGQKDGVYLGKVVRWYYAEGDYTAIHYVGSGNKVPKSEGASPLMDLPETFPDNVNYGWYIAAAADILTNIGRLAKTETAELF